MKNLRAIYSHELPIVSIAQEDDQSATVYYTGNHTLKPLHYATLWTVLISMLYDEPWNTIWPDAERKRLIEIINKIYFFRVKRGCASDLKRRMRLLRAYSSELDFNYQTQVHGDDVAKSEFIMPILEIAKGDSFNYDLKSYEGMLALVEEKSIQTDMLQVFYSFPSVWDMACWLLEQAIQENRRILKCQNCGKLFFPNRYGMVYCGENCRKEWNKRARLEGDTEIKKEYAAIIAVFERREKSHGDYMFDGEEYAYGEELSDLFPDEMNKRIGESLSGRTRAMFYQDDFVWIHSNFLRENKTRWQKVKKAKEKTDRRELDTKDYLRVRELYLTWLKRIHAQIRSFRLVRQIGYSK